MNQIICQYVGHTLPLEPIYLDFMDHNTTNLIILINNLTYNDPNFDPTLVVVRTRAYGFWVLFIVFSSLFLL